MISPQDGVLFRQKPNSYEEGRVTSPKPRKQVRVVENNPFLEEEVERERNRCQSEPNERRRRPSQPFRSSFNVMISQRAQSFESSAEEIRENPDNPERKSRGRENGFSSVRRRDKSWDQKWRDHLLSNSTENLSLEPRGVWRLNREPGKVNPDSYWRRTDRSSVPPQSPAQPRRNARVSRQNSNPSELARKTVMVESQEEPVTLIQRKNECNGAVPVFSPEEFHNSYPKELEDKELPVPPNGSDSTAAEGTEGQSALEETPQANEVTEQNIPKQADINPQQPPQRGEERTPPAEEPDYDEVTAEDDEVCISEADREKERNQREFISPGRPPMSPRTVQRRQRIVIRVRKSVSPSPAAQQPHQSVGSAGTFLVNNFEDDEDSDEGEWYVPENVGPTGMPIVSGQNSTPLVNGHQVKYA